MYVCGLSPVVVWFDVAFSRRRIDTEVASTNRTYVYLFVCKTPLNNVRIPVGILRMYVCIEYAQSSELTHLHIKR